MDYQVWLLLKECLTGGERILEVGPGHLPRIPVGGSYFVDLDGKAIKRLRRAGGKALLGSVEDLPYCSEAFSLVYAFEVLEHVKEHERAFGEIHRVLRRGGVFVFSVPLFKRYWSLIDELTGHERRYEPLDLALILEITGFRVEGFLCPRNLHAFMIESRFLRPLVVGLRVLLALVEKTAPTFLPMLYQLFALSPLNQLRGMGSVSWEDRHLGKIENRCEVIVVCRKSANH